MIRLAPPATPTTAVGCDQAWTGPSGIVRVDVDGKPVDVVSAVLARDEGAWWGTGSGWRSEGGACWVAAYLANQSDTFAVEAMVPRSSSSRASLLSMGRAQGRLEGAALAGGARVIEAPIHLWRREVLHAKGGTNTALKALAIRMASGKPHSARYDYRLPGVIPAHMLDEHTAEAYCIALWAAGWRVTDG